MIRWTRRSKDEAAAFLEICPTKAPWPTEGLHHGGMSIFEVDRQTQAGPHRAAISLIANVFAGSRNLVLAQAHEIALWPSPPS